MKEVLQRIDYQMNSYLEINQQPIYQDELQLEQTAVIQRRASPNVLKHKGSDNIVQKCASNKSFNQNNQFYSERSKENIKYQNSPSQIKNRKWKQILYFLKEVSKISNKSSKNYLTITLKKMPIIGILLSLLKAKIYLIILIILFFQERHQRSPVLFFCTKQECKSRLKIGCAYCMLDDHADHADFKIQIEDFLKIIQYKYDSYYQCIRDFQHTLLENEKPFILKIVSQQISQMKEVLCQKLDSINSKIQKQYQQFLMEDNLNTVKLVQDQKLFSSLIEKVMQTNILNISEEQRDAFMRLYNDTETRKIQKRIEEIIQINDQITKQFDFSFQSFQNNLQDKLSSFLYKIDNFQLNFDINPEEQAIDYLIERKHSLVKKIQKTNKMKEEIKEINKEIQMFKIQKASSPFPYQLYGGLCDHVNFQCNTIQIYECCNQAFPCPECHKNSCQDHKIFYTSPSRRYCIDCLAIFQVNHPTNTLINCTSCISDGQKTIKN